jgi:hypothetical protein
MTDTTSDWYRTFAEQQARGSSATYEEWALGVSDDRPVLELIDQLPRGKRQPNLIFAAARASGVPYRVSYDEFRQWLIEHWDQVSKISRARLTQTNEAARCAALLPALSAIEGPLALLELGASAGLCLYPDRYSYHYRTPTSSHRLDPADGPSEVLLTCHASDPSLVPDRLPTIVWRAGLDLNPLDVTKADDVAWLQNLVWPEHHDRRDRIPKAAQIARRDPPHMVQGDLQTDLDDLIAQAPREATLVIFHSAVLAYLDPEDRDRVGARLQELAAIWLSNEGVRALGSVAAQLPGAYIRDNRFVVARNTRPLYLAGPHGATLDPLIPPPTKRRTDHA